MLIVFHIIMSITRHNEAPKKRLSRGRRRLYAVLRYADGIMIVGGLFGLSIALLHNELLFILLPTGLSVAVAALTMRARASSRNAILFTAAVALAYYAAITGWELLTHPSTTSKIVLVTTTLAIAVILEPVRALVQSVGEQRLHLLDDTNARTVDAFTSALREEIDLDHVRERFFQVVQTTMQPRFVSLWVREQATDAAADVSAPGDETTASNDPSAISMPSVTVSPRDPLVAYALAHPGALELARLQLSSDAVRTLRQHEAELALPLISQGELIGLLALGPRLDDADYTRDDRRLLASLAAQAAPALRVAQMVRTRQTEVRERERIEQEMRTAQQIQRTFLPKDIPARPGWEIVPFYQPAREVGGDFYDLLQFADGSLGLVIGDVTGKGVPAALVMTAARTMLRTAAQEDAAPGSVFTRVNELLHADIPGGMFVTSFYARLDPTTGRLNYANAGQDYPYVRRGDGGVGELRATGMPLGLMPGTTYDEYETTLSAGDSVLFFSDGLVEAHNAEREMFGLPRVAELVASAAGGTELIDAVMTALGVFAGADWEQEDDVTLLSFGRKAAAADTQTWTDHSREPMETYVDDIADGDEQWRALGAFTVASAPGNEREAIARVAEVARALGLDQPRLERLQTAVGEATMNAMEHGNHFDPALRVEITLRASREMLSVLITDHGTAAAPPVTDAPTPDLAAKLAGTQSPRGWGLFLIRNLVDEVRVRNAPGSHTVELLMRLPAGAATSDAADDAPGGQG